jgi:hypothetical protein
VYELDGTVTIGLDRDDVYEIDTTFQVLGILCFVFFDV